MLKSTTITHYLQLSILNTKSLLITQFLSPRVLTLHSRVVLCRSQSSGPLINRLELLTEGSSIPCCPCHLHDMRFHYGSFWRRGTEGETGRDQNLPLISILIKRPSDNDQSKQSAGQKIPEHKGSQTCHRGLFPQPIYQQITAQAREQLL